MSVCHPVSGMWLACCCPYIIIDNLSEFDQVGEVNMKEIRWYGGVVKNISDVTWVNQSKRRQGYKENEAVFFWDEVPETDYPTSCSIEPFDENKWNKNCYGSWRK